MRQVYPRVRRGWAVGIASALVTILAACGPDDAAPAPAPEATLWEPTTVPFDPVCRACPVVHEYEDQHSGARVQVYYSPSADDPLVQWAGCLDSVLTCVRKGGELPGCTAASTCPAPCREQYAEEVQGADRDQQFDRFEARFVAEGAPCRPAREEVAP